MSNEKQVAVKAVLDFWNSRIKEADTLIESLTDEQLQKEVAPGKNRGIYLLGHLTAVHDRMIPLLNFGEQLYPELGDVFLTKPDKSGAAMPSVEDLRARWKNANSKLATHFNNLKPEEWFEKHTSVSAEDFAKEPHRNRLNVVIGRAGHLAYHVGQMVFLKNK